MPAGDDDAHAAPADEALDAVLAGDEVTDLDGEGGGAEHESARDQAGAHEPPPRGPGLRGRPRPPGKANATGGTRAPVKREREGLEGVLSPERALRRWALSDERPRALAGVVPVRADGDGAVRRSR